MRKLVLLILLATAVSFAQQPGAAPPSKAKILTRVEFDALLATPGRVFLIDVRRPTEISMNGGFPVYLNIQADDKKTSRRNPQRQAAHPGLQSRTPGGNRGGLAGKQRVQNCGS